MTFEQAQALKPGDKVLVSVYSPVNGRYYTTEWTVYEPPKDRRFDDDSTILAYLTAAGLQSYVLSDQLEKYYLKENK